MKTRDRHWTGCGRVTLSAALCLAAASVLNAAEGTNEKRELAWRETPASLALLECFGRGHDQVDGDVMDAVMLELGHTLPPEDRG